MDVQGWPDPYVYGVYTVPLAEITTYTVYITVSNQLDVT